VSAGAMRRGCALALAAVVVAGCSGNDPVVTVHAKRPHAKRAPAKTSPVKRPHGRDLAWLARLHNWQVGIRAALDRSDAVYDDVVDGTHPKSDLRPALRPLVHCAESLRREVGEPKTPPYPPIYVELQKGCKSLRHAALALAGTLGDRRPQAEKEVKKTTPRIETFFEQADQEIRWTMRANRALPTRR